MEKEIPKGSTREDIKARKKIIWNKSLHAYIHVKFQSINETKGHAALSIKSTLAVFSLTKILKEAYVVEKWAPKYDDKNQKPYSFMLLMRWKTYRLIVGYQKSTMEYVQYYVGNI